MKYEVVADVPELKKLISEFGKIGSNLNQIAKYFNQGGIHSQEMRAAINQCITELYEMKYMVGMIQPYLRGLHLSAVHYLQQ